MDEAQLLVTTALEDTWGRDENLVFLGEWCKKYSRKHKWCNRKFSTLPYHWEDREKLQKDYDYLANFYEVLLKELVHKLNSIHIEEHSQRYWRIIIGPWLITYVAVIWDRWESIKYACDTGNQFKTIVSDQMICRSVPCDWRTGMGLMDDDEWNYLIYCDIFQAQGVNNLTLVKEKLIIKDKKNKPYRKYDSLLAPIAKVFDFIARKIWFTDHYDILLYSSYFSLHSLIELSLKLYQIPRLYFEFDKELYCREPELSLRTGLEYTQGSNLFEQFVFEHVLADMPLTYIEGYKEFLSYSKSLPKANIIMTANAHYGNELFKIWAAEQVESGSKLIISDHGGAISSKMSLFNHEEKICDKKTVWHIPFDSKHIKLPPNKIINRIKKSNGKQITLVGLELPRYSYRCQSGPNSSLILSDYKQKADFVKMLSIETRECFKIRPYSDIGWSTKNRYIDQFGSEIISTKAKLLDEYSNSKLIICTYPQTTFSEAMHSGVPTILLYPKKYWELNSAFDELVSVLEEAKIIFSDPLLAAKHVNTISNNPVEWWEKEQTIYARSMFFRFCGEVNDNPLGEWATFFRKMNDEYLRSAEKSEKQC
jgi:putative transferase (TIGR04331 family)